MPRIPTRTALLLLLALVVPAAPAGAPPAGAKLLSVTRIWDAGRHNAFTDLILWRGHWWCAFREADEHVGGDGVIRILESTDGRAWTPAAAVRERDIDLRDPKLSVTPDGRLMLVAGGSLYRGTKQLKGLQPRVSFSTDGRGWSEPERILAEGDWLWRVTWHQGVAYGASYRSRPERPAGPDAPDWPLTLHASRDGRTWEQVTQLAVDGRPNETTLRFTATGEMVALVRREAGDQLGWLGVASPPFRDWKWTRGSHRLGGPDFIAAPGGGWIAGTRDHTRPSPVTGRGVSTQLARLGGDGTLRHLITLPSAGDTSYPGLAWHPSGELWVSYYSSHEGKSAIYLARVAVD